MIKYKIGTGKRIKIGVEVTGLEDPRFTVRVISENKEISIPVRMILGKINIEIKHHLDDLVPGI